MKITLTLTVVILFASAFTTAALAGPSFTSNQPEANLNRSGEPGDLELLDQFSLTEPLGMVTSRVIAAPDSPVATTNLGMLTQVGALESSLILELAVQGSYAYAGFGSTLVVIDITDPADMHRVASLQLAGKIQAIQADQDYLYVSSFGSGLWIVDIRNPLAPVKMGFYPSNSTGVLAVQGDYAYLFADSGLEILDISARDDPRLVGSTKVNGLISDIAAKDSYLYLSVFFSSIYPGGILILDITDPIQPVYAGQYIPAGSAWVAQIEIRNSTLYYADELNGLQVLDITVPAEPKLVGGLVINGNRGLATSVDRVYLAFESCLMECQGGFEIIDVSDPSGPNLIGTYSSIALVPTSITASGGNVFLTHTGEVQSIDASLPSAPILVDSLHSSLNAPNKIAVAEDYAYIIDYDNDVSSRLRIADITNPYQPSVTGQLTLPSTLTDVEISGNIAIVTQAIFPPGISSVYFIDVSNPQNPVEAGRFDAQPVGFRGVGVQGEYAYVTWDGYPSSDWVGVYVLNISDPTNPQKVGFYELQAFREYHGIADVFLDGDYAYIPYLYGLLVLDISDPENPVKAGEFGNYTSVSDIALDGNLAYLASWPGVILLDVSNPANPVEISTFEIQAGTSGVVVQDHYLYVSSDIGLSVLDVSHPLAPTLAAFLPSMEGQDVSIQGREIFFTSSEGFQILHLTGTISGVVRQPNRLPVPGVTITANGIFSATTTTTGAFAFEGMEPGSYSVVPSITGSRFTPGQYQLDVPPSRIANFTMLPLPVSAELTPGAATTLVYTDTQGLPASLIFPAGAVASDTTVVITPTVASDHAGNAFAGHAFELAAYQGGAIVPELSFYAPISVTIQYSPADTVVVSDTTGLALYRWDQGAWLAADDGCPESALRTAQVAGVFQSVICQTGRYALFGLTHAVALPLVSYGSDAGGLPPLPPVNEVSFIRQ